jgi:DNA invertase Pin-like site-specific DNA recombinase
LTDCKSVGDRRRGGGRQPKAAQFVAKRRAASIDAGQVRELKAQGLGATEIAKTLKIGRASAYRVLE